MNEPLKVLLIQRRYDRGLLRRALQSNPGLRFKWQRLFSECELRTAAREYAAAVVLCADDMHDGSARAVLDMVSVLSKQPPQLMVHELCDDSAPWNRVATMFAAPRFAPGFSGRLEAASGRPPLPGLLRDDPDALLMLDGKGWVTDLNPRARRLLGIGIHQRPKAQAHLQDLIGALQAAGEGRCVSLPLVGLNLDGLLLLNGTPGERHGDAALNLISSVVQPQYARCGLLARIGADRYLAKLPHMSPAADASVSVCRDANIIEPAKQATSSRLRAHPEPMPRVAADLVEAIQRQALSVHFQPQYELAGGRGCGAEALVRWTLASGRHRAPDFFIPIAERSGSIGALDAWVLQTACAAALRWRGTDARQPTLSVNVSDRQIGPEHSRTLTEVLRSSRFPAQRLELEIGEGAVTSTSSQVKECLQEWKHLGVRIAVTHKAANYSSLDYLSRTPVDRLKLDKSLIQGMTRQPRTAATVRAIIALGSELQVDVIAEGVETPAQLTMLKDFDCPHAQGFLLARPMPAVQAQVVLGKTWGNLQQERACASVG